MALTIQITYDYGGGHAKTYDLLAESITHIQERLPVVSPLPSGKGKGFKLDLGMERHTINISGNVNNVSTGASDPTKENLVYYTRTYFGSNYITRLITPTMTYKGVIRSIEYRSEGGTEDRWTFNMAFLVEDFVS